MYTSHFYKFKARESLNGNYFTAFIGAIISFVPMYLLYLVETLLAETGSYTLTIVTVIELLFSLFISNIFTVGLIRFLMNIKNTPKQDEVSEKRHDYNLVLSGFTNNFKNTFKTTLLMNVYLLGWGLLSFVPYFIVIGLVSYLAVSTEHITQVFVLANQLFTSPSCDMIVNLSDYIIQNCAYLPLLLMIASVSSLALTIPVIRKSYEYAVIPFIIAENPDTPSNDAFNMARTMMKGHKWRYFCLQFSFIGYAILVSLVLSFTMTMPLYLIAQAALTAYMQMAYIHFYEMRKNSSDNYYANQPHFEEVTKDQSQAEEAAEKQPQTEEASEVQPMSEETAEELTQSEEATDEQIQPEEINQEETTSDTEEEEAL